MCKRWIAVCRWLPTTAAVRFPTSKCIVFTTDCAPIAVRRRSNRALCPSPTSTNSRCLFGCRWPSMDDCRCIVGKCRLEVTLFWSVTADGKSPSHGRQGGGDTGLQTMITTLGCWATCLLRKDTLKNGPREKERNWGSILCGMDKFAVTDGR